MWLRDVGLPELKWSAPVVTARAIAHKSIVKPMVSWELSECWWNYFHCQRWETKVWHCSFNYTLISCYRLLFFCRVSLQKSETDFSLMFKIHHKQSFYFFWPSDSLSSRLMKSCRSSRSPVRRFRDRSIMCARSPMWWPMARRSRPLSLSLTDCRVSRIWGEKISKFCLLKQAGCSALWMNSD